MPKEKNYLLKNYYNIVFDRHSLHDLHSPPPITDIALVGSKLDIPSSYTVIEKTTQNGDANLLGSSSESLYFAISRDPNLNPITDILLIEGINYPAPKDYIKLAPLYIKRSRSHLNIYITRRKSAGNNIIQLDLISLLTNYTEEKSENDLGSIGDNFEVIKKNIYCGKGDGTIFMLLRRQGNTIFDLKLNPKVIRRFPNEKSSGVESLLAHIALPNSLKFVKRSIPSNSSNTEETNNKPNEIVKNDENEENGENNVESEEKKERSIKDSYRMFQTVLTDERGKETYIVSLTYLHPISTTYPSNQSINQREEGKKYLKEIIELAKSHNKDFIEPKIEEYNDILEERAVILTSRIPAYKFMCDLLYFFYENYLSHSLSQNPHITNNNNNNHSSNLGEGELGKSIEEFLFPLFYISLSRKNNISIELERKSLQETASNLSSIGFDLPPELSLPFEDLPDFLQLFSSISLPNILWLIHFILLEHSLLIVSSNALLLSRVLEQIRILLFPFEWQFVYIPSLQENMVDVVESPFPFIAGLNTSNVSLLRNKGIFSSHSTNNNENSNNFSKNEENYGNKERRKSKFGGVVLFDLDLGYFGHTPTKKGIFSEPFFSEFMNDLIDAGLKYDKSSIELKEIARCDKNAIYAIRAAFLKLFIQVISPNYIKYLKFPVDAENAKLEELFDLKKYLQNLYLNKFSRRKSRETFKTSFITKFVRTEIFSSFILNSTLLELKQSFFFTDHNTLNFFKCCCAKFIECSSINYSYNYQNNERSRSKGFLESISNSDSLVSINDIFTLNDYLRNFLRLHPSTKMLLKNKEEINKGENGDDYFMIDEKKENEFIEFIKENGTKFKEMLRIRPSSVIKYLISNKDSVSNIDKDSRIFSETLIDSSKRMSGNNNNNGENKGTFWNFARSFLSSSSSSTNSTTSKSSNLPNLPNLSGGKENGLKRVSIKAIPSNSTTHNNNNYSNDYQNREKLNGDKIKSIKMFETFNDFVDDYLQQIYALFFFLSATKSIISLMEENENLYKRVLKEYKIMTEEIKVPGNSLSLKCLLDITARLSKVSDANLIYREMNRQNITMSLSNYKSYSSILASAAHRRSICGIRPPFLSTPNNINNNNNMAKLEIGSSKEEKKEEEKGLDFESVKFVLKNFCTNCSKMQNEIELMLTFERNGEDKNRSTKCLYCLKDIIPFFHVKYKLMNGEEKEKKIVFMKSNVLLEEILLEEKVLKQRKSKNDKGKSEKGEIRENSESSENSKSGDLNHLDNDKSNNKSDKLEKNGESREFDVILLFKTKPTLFWNIFLYFAKMKLPLISTHFKGGIKEIKFERFETEEEKEERRSVEGLKISDFEDIREVQKFRSCLESKNLESSLMYNLSMRKIYAVREDLNEREKLFKRFIRRNFYKNFLDMKAAEMFEMSKEKFEKELVDLIQQEDSGLAELIEAKDKIHSEKYYYLKNIWQKF